MTQQTEVKLVGLQKIYRMGEVEVRVLRGIDLEIYKGELLVILGASGSGKSTLLNMIGGVDRPSAGEIWFDEKNLAQMSDRELTDYRRAYIGFVFQFYNLVGALTARENVQVSTEIVSKPMNAIAALERMDLGEYVDHFPAQLSGGQQQRVAIARALAKNPRLMLCDEPTGALDSKTGQMVLKLLARLNEELNTTTVIITHSQQIAQIAHRIIYIKNGIVDKSWVNDKRPVEEISW